MPAEEQLPDLAVWVELVGSAAEWEAHFVEIHRSS